jgi:hypothetical protein
MARSLSEEHFRYKGPSRTPWNFYNTKEASWKNASDTKVPLRHLGTETSQTNISETKVPLGHLESL